MANGHRAEENHVSRVSELWIIFVLWQEGQCFGFLEDSVEMGSRCRYRNAKPAGCILETIPGNDFAEQTLFSRSKIEKACNLLVTGQGAPDIVQENYGARLACLGIPV